MKKIVYTIIIISLAAVSLTACQKEEKSWGKYTFRAYTDQSGKSHMDGLDMIWDDDDEIMISDGENGARFLIPEGGNRGTSATFATEEEFEYHEGSPYYAVHPSSIFEDYQTVNIPATQYYTENSLMNSPMYAVTTNTDIQFNNLCGAIKLTLQKENAIVYGIRITTDKQICGSFPIESVTEDGATKYQVSAQVGTNNRTIELSCGTNGVSINSEKNFVIYLPVGQYTKFEINILSTNESHADLSSSATATQPLTFNRNHIKTVSKNGSNLIFESRYATDGIFSVSDEHTVFFAKGNLQWNNVNGTETWTFAENQYDYYTDETMSHLDHFAWPETHSHYGTNASGQHQQCNHDFTDWGENVIGGDLANTWRTLSVDEWHYLLFERRSNGKMVNDVQEYGKGYFTINGNRIPMLVIYPDNMPADQIILSDNPGWIPTTGGQWPTQWHNNLTQADYNRLNALGCAILPLAGYDQFNANNSTPNTVNRNHLARYATSSTADLSNVWYVTKYYMLATANGNVEVGGTIVDDMAEGNAVRLVQNNY